MLLDNKNFRKMLQSLDKSRVLRLVCNRNLHSICALVMLTHILKKDLIKYQIEFKSMETATMICFEDAGIEYRLSNELEMCACKRNDTVGITVLYTVIKSMNLLKIETLWPVAVCFAYYKQFANENNYFPHIATDEQNSENPSNIPTDNKDDEQILCQRCTEVHSEIQVSIKMLSCRLDGVFNLKKSRLEFLQGSTLFESIRNDMKFMHEKKLFYTKNANAERRIGEFLAKRGISLNAAHELYSGLDMQTRSLCASTFGESEKFIMRQGHDIEITAVEHGFLILFYLYREKDIYGYMCLDRRKLIDITKACKFYQKMTQMYREAVLTASRVRNIVLFRIRNETFSTGQMSVISEILNSMFRIYLKYRNEHRSKIVLYYDEEKIAHVLYSENDLLKSVKRELKEEIGPNLIRIRAQDMPVILNNLI